MPMDNPLFEGVGRLWGSQTLERFSASCVAIVGLGGVGSWAAEFLVRTGVGGVVLVDADCVEPSNTNRQLPAMQGNYGRAKTEVLGERFAAIHPDLRIRMCKEYLDGGNAGRLLEGCDAVCDCIDTMSSKAALLAWCVGHGVLVCTSGGAGGRTDPGLVKTADLAFAGGDPLLGRLRSVLRRQYGFAKGENGKPGEPFGIDAVFSTQPMVPSQDGSGRYGVFAGVTAAFGCRIAHRVLCGLASRS